MTYTAAYQPWQTGPERREPMAPAAAPQLPRPSSPPWLVMLLVAAIALLVARQWDGGGDPDDGGLWGTVERQCAQALEAYEAGLVQNMEEMAIGIESGQLKTKEQVAKEGVARRTKLHADAYFSVNNLDNEYVPDEITPENRQRTAEYLRAKARGFRKGS